ncbi:MAG: acetoacetate decarboxylase family protein [Actinobacteria bacterium]|nr:acetoacetate decarboxylase family protein [Actinomycetota bacterium]
MGAVKDFVHAQRRENWIWRDASVIAADLEVDARSASAWLPGWLRILEPARATVFVADYPHELPSGVNPYHETAILLHVRLGRKEGVFCPWMLVDDDAAMLLGRESLGYPKKMGEISLDAEGGRVKARVERKGTLLLDIAGEIGDEDPAPPPMFARNFFNVWGPVGLTFQKILYFSTQEEIIAAHRVSADVSLGSSETDPLHEPGWGKVVSAYLYRLDFGSTRTGKLPLPLLPVSPAFMYRHWNLRYL